ncbi:glutamate racemase [Morococcus cerebrosus]|uniref:Glutamate racemase n=1 Tax=Morococcus cerebrosus TaxID=1056807 RepID=A0A0C1E5P2_9NEIS|nr:glutamate racemase [Morococcus cerebrosus]
MEHEVTHLTVCEYLKPLLAHGIDTLVLGCTHFPLLKPLIGREAGNVALVDSTITTAEETARVLAQEELLNTDNNNPDYRFYVSDIPLKFRTIGERFLGRTMEQIEMVSLG